MQIRYIVQRARPVTYPHGSGLLERSRRGEAIFVEGIGRVFSGALIVVLGILLLSLSAAILGMSTAEFDDIDYNFGPVGWGIWSGGFTFISGVCGIASLKIKLMVYVFLGTSLVSAFMCIGGCVWTTLTAYNIYLFLTEQYHSTAYNHMYLYTAMSIALAVQTMVSLIGASFTWTTLRKNRIPRQQTQVEAVFAHNTEDIRTSDIDSPNFSSVTSPPSQETPTNGTGDVAHSSVLSGSRDSMT